MSLTQSYVWVIRVNLLCFPDDDFGAMNKEIITWHINTVIFIEYNIHWSVKFDNGKYK